ncbi:hypothetical protein SEA_MOLLYMUR_59 [Gordonia phage Mollymur]|uniref:Uncharacterized protein n=1 Tax=Gordonia phage Mollymur TaxID=2590895 RepID=A0A4Y6EBS3_9CAUD|nr:hypothetical protein PQB84_gp066 [Gordonia phage Mollymur]QDF15420.1 hypothetical protein SEA_MOLLYMUR_59 [Gordonia phage Mollymur]
MGIQTRMHLDEENKTYRIEVVPESTTDVPIALGVFNSTAQRHVAQVLSRHLGFRTEAAAAAAAVAVTELMRMFHLTPKTVAEMEQAR